MSNSTKTFSARYAAWLAAHAKLVVLICVLITAGSVALATKLHISTDLWALLPSKYPSVQNLQRLSKRVGGFSTLNIAVESSDPAANRKFADDLVALIQHDLADQIISLDYKIDAIRNFYEAHAAVYLSVDDLKSIELDLTQAIHDKKVAASPLPYNLGLDDPPADGAKTKTPAERIRERLNQSTSKFDRYPSGYFAGEEGKLLAIYVRPKASSGDPANAHAFIQSIERLVKQLDPHKYAPSMKVMYTGTFQLSLDEQEAIVRDLVSTAGLCIGLIALAVTLYFRSFRVVALLGITLLCGAAWSFGLARIAVGYLNIQTAFLGSIIAGTGINYGIILLARYLEERRNGRTELESLDTAFHGTFTSTLTAAATTAISFGTLLSSTISSFQHFSIIGGGGILFCWVLSYTFLPALLLLSDRFLSTARSHRGVTHLPLVMAKFPVEHPKTFAFGSIGLAVAGLGLLVHFLPNILETDGRKLRTKSSMESGAAKLDERISKFRSGSGSPGLVVTDSLEDARTVCEVVLARIAHEGTAKAPYNDCKSIYTLLPTDQDAKLVIARRIVKQVDEMPTELIDAQLRIDLENLRKKLVLEPVTMASLPEPLVRPFRERTGEIGRVVSIDPPRGRDLWIAENLYQFTDALRRIDLPDGRFVESSGDSVIFADILREIRKDTPRTTALALLGVIMVVFVALRGGRGTVHVVFSLLVGVAWMVGIQSAMSVKLNFFNFVALPTTFGIAVDYAINIYSRFADNVGERKARMIEALRTTGGAVVLCSMTTTIGYFTLIIADNRALVSFGKLAMLGEVTTMLAALVVLPATLMLDKKS